MAEFDPPRELDRQEERQRLPGARHGEEREARSRSTATTRTVGAEPARGTPTRSRRRRPAARWFSTRSSRSRPSIDSDADLPPLLPRGHLRLVRDEHRRRATPSPAPPRWDERWTHNITIYPLPHQPVIKDLVSDLTTCSTRSTTSVEPWLKSDDSGAAREASGCSPPSRPREARRRCTSASCARAARRAARATGGTPIEFLGPAALLAILPLAGRQPRRRDPEAPR